MYEQSLYKIHTDHLKEKSVKRNNRYKKSYLVKKAPEFSNKNIEKETIIFEIKNESESESESESEVVEETESEVVEETESTDISSNDNNDNDVIA